MNMPIRIHADQVPSLVRHAAEPERGTHWCQMHAGAPEFYHPCFSPRLLRDLKRAQEEIRHEVASSPAGLQHLVLTSESDVFNLGGDLSLFARLIRTGNRAALLDYARLCVEVAYNFHRLCEDRVHSIAVIEGDALGGGFEAALCCHTIIAEEGTGMGFPEVLFDLFPGMGAYTFLTRRVSAVQAERMMLDARVYPVEELAAMGIVDMVVPKGEGRLAAQALIKRHGRMRNALQALNTIRHACNPVRLDELLEITTEWVDAALRLDDRALRTMERLIRAQQRRAAAPGTQPAASTVLG